MEQRLSLITLGVDDLKKSRHFYETGIGWKVSSASTGDICFMQLNGIALALYSRAELAKDACCIANKKTAFGGLTLAYNTRTREEVDAVLAKAKSAGAKISKPAQSASWGGYSGYFSDPDGHLWEVAWNTGFKIDANGNLKLPE